MKLQNGVFLILLILNTSLSYGQQTNVFTTAGFINDLDIDSTNLWAATTGGLAKVNLLNGQKTIYNVGNSVLTYNEVSTVLCDNTGKIWCGGYNKLHCLQGNNWTSTHTLSNGDTIAQIIDIKQNKQGKLYFSNAGQSLIIKDGGTDSVFHATSLPIVQKGISDFDVDTLNHIWFATPSGMVFYNGTNFTVYDTTNTIFNDLNFRRVVIDKKGIVWAITQNFATQTNALYKFDGSNWSKIIGAQAASAAKATRIYVGEDNKKYFTGYTISGVYIFNDTNWTLNTTYSNQAVGVICKKNNLVATSPIYGDPIKIFNGASSQTYTTSLQNFSSNYFNSLCLAPNNYVWASNNNSIYYTNGVNFYNIPNPPGMPYITKIKFDNSGNLWCISNDNNTNPTAGVAKYDGSNWTVYPFTFDFSDITIDKFNNVWFATKNGLMKYDGNVFHSFAVPEPLTNQSTTYLYEVEADTSGNIWFSDYYGFGVFDGTTFNFYNFSTIPLLQPYNNFSVRIDSKNNIWALDSIGELIRFDGVNWSVFNSSNSSWPLNAYYPILCAEKNGILWFKTMLNGFVSFNGTTFRHYDAATYHISPYLTDLTVDNNNNIWFTSSGSLGVTSPFDYDGFLEIEPGSVISGCTFIDNNSNANLDSLDSPIPNQTILLKPDSVYKITNQNGKYSVYTTTGIKDISVIPPVHWGTNGNPNVLVNVDSVFECCYNFELAPQLLYHDVKLSLINSTFRCNITTPYWIDIYNRGTVSEDTRVYFIHDPLLTYMGSNPAASFTSGDSIFWDFNQVSPFTHKQVVVYLKTPTPTISVNQQLKTEAGLKLINTGVSLGYDTLSDIIRCSYDPNDKVVKPVGAFAQHLTLKNDSLTYTIRFQNTGTDTAFTVLIYDTLNQNFDIKTFHLLASSHQVDVKYDNRGNLRFAFNNILLPDSNINELASHGFVRYSIKPKQNLFDSTLVKNKAYIYFDFNQPIVTNTTFNTLVSQMPLGYNSIAKNKLNLLIYPNPGSKKVNFLFAEFSNTIDVKIYDLMGSLIYKKLINQPSFSIASDEIGSGFFIVTLTDSMGKIQRGKFYISD